MQTAVPVDPPVLRNQSAVSDWVIMPICSSRVFPFFLASTTRRAIKEMKDIIDADYEYSNEKVREAQSKITVIERVIDRILSETGV